MNNISTAFQIIEQGAILMLALAVLTSSAASIWLALVKNVEVAK